MTKNNPPKRQYILRQGTERKYIKRFPSTSQDEVQETPADQKRTLYEPAIKSESPSASIKSQDVDGYSVEQTEIDSETIDDQRTEKEWQQIHKRSTDAFYEADRLRQKREDEFEELSRIYEEQTNEMIRRNKETEQRREEDRRHQEAQEHRRREEEDPGRFFNDW